MQTIQVVVALLFLLIMTVDTSTGEDLSRVLQDLNDSNVDVRAKAVNSLGHSTDPRALDILVKALSDESWYVRMEAASALGLLNDSRAVIPLVRALKDPDCDVRIVAAKVLGDISDLRTEEHLILALNDNNCFVREEATRALGKLNSSKAADQLIQELKSNDSQVKIMAIEALGLLKSTKAREPLLQALKDDDADVRSRAAHALGDLKYPDVAPSLIEALEDNDSILNAEAAWALGELKEKEAVEPLVRLLEDRKWYVRAEAAEALGKINDSRAVMPLIKALNDEDSVVRRLVAKSLGMTKNATAVEPLTLALKDADEQVRASAAVALIYVNITQAAKAMPSTLLYGSQGPVFRSQEDVFAPMYAKKIIIRADDIAEYNPFVGYMSNVTMDKGIKTTYAVIPLRLERNDRSDNAATTYLNGLDKHFELATHGYDHVIFDGRSYSEQLSMVKNATSLMEDLFGRIPSTFVPPFHKCDMNTTKACSAVGYHSLSSGHLPNQAYIRNFGTGFMWEVDWDSKPVTISSYQNFQKSFDKFYSSTSEFLVILLHPTVIFQNTSGGFNRKNMELYERSIDYMASKDVEFVTIEEAYQWSTDKNAIRLGKVSSNVYVVDMATCRYNHTIKLNSTIHRVVDISTGDLVPLTSERSFEGVREKRYEVILADSEVNLAL